MTAPDHATARTAPYRAVFHGGALDGREFDGLPSLAPLRVWPLPRRGITDPIPRAWNGKDPISGDFDLYVFHEMDEEAGVATYALRERRRREP